MKIIVQNDREHPEDVDALAAYLARTLRSLGFTVEHAEEPHEPGDVPIPNRVTDMTTRFRSPPRAVVVEAQGKRSEKPQRAAKISPEQHAEIEARVKARVKPREEPKKSPEQPPKQPAPEQPVKAPKPRRGA